MRFDPLYVVAGTTFDATGRTITIPNLDGRAAVFERKFSGKWYFEFILGPGGSAGTVGVQACDSALPVTAIYNTVKDQWSISAASALWMKGVNTSSYTATGWVPYDIIGVAADLTGGKIYFSRNGTWQGTSNPSGGTNEADATVTSTFGFVPFCAGLSGGYIWTGTIALTPAQLAYALPTGYSAWGASAKTADPVNKATSITLSNSNRTIAEGGTSHTSGAYCDEGIVSRKAYFEAKFDTPGVAGQTAVGLCAYQKLGDTVGDFIAFTAASGATDDQICVTDAGVVYTYNTPVYTGSSFSNSDTCMFAFDGTSGKVWVGKNGTWWNSGDPANGLNPVYTAVNYSKTYHAAAKSNAHTNAWQVTVNFGSAAPTYTPPAGFAMMGYWRDTIASAAAGVSTMAAKRKVLATLASTGAGTTAMLGSRKFSVTIASTGAGTTAFTPAKKLYATLASAGIAASAMLPKATYHVTLASSAKAYGIIDLTEIPYIGYVANRANGAHSVYADFNFNSMTSSGQVFYGARPDGLYVLDGGTDLNGQEIDARIRTGRDILGTDQQKRVAAAYVGIKANGTMQVKVLTDSGLANIYNLVVANPQRSLGRAKLGKGFRSDTYQFEIVNTAGLDFDMDVIEVYPVVLQRRVP
jgi:hypothetical protein